MKGTATTWMGRQRRRFLREERGAISVWFFFAMIPLLAMLGVAVDIGLIAAARIQLQRGADAGSHAGVKAMRDGLPDGAVIARARQIVEDNVTLSGVTWHPEPQLGTYDLTSETFSPGLSVHGVPAVQVEPVVPDLPLTLLPILGFSSARVEAHAISIGKKRELVIVQDISNSFCDVFDAARTADRLLVQRMAAQSVFGDSVGVVTFGDGVTTEQDLTPLDGRSGEVISAINSMSCAPEWTNTGAGIRRATELFEDSDPAETERVIILVTDGVPNRSPGNPAALAAMQSAAIDAATAAGDEGIHIFGVHLTSSAGDALRNEIRKIQDLISAADGMGTYHQTPDPDDLDEILLTILGGLPIHLAE